MTTKYPDSKYEVIRSSGYQPLNPRESGRGAKDAEPAVFQYEAGPAPNSRPDERFREYLRRTVPFSVVFGLAMFKCVMLLGLCGAIAVVGFKTYEEAYTVKMLTPKEGDEGLNGGPADEGSRKVWK